MRWGWREWDIIHIAVFPFSLRVHLHHTLQQLLPFPQRGIGPWRILERLDCPWSAREESIGGYTDCSVVELVTRRFVDVGEKIT